MIRKRRSLSTSRSAKEAAPVLAARQVRPPVRRRSSAVLEASSQVSTNDVLLGSDEFKQALIRAHAEARRAQGVKPHARFWVMASVIGVALVLLIGWWVTFGRSVEQATNDSQGLFQQIQDRSQVLQQDIGSIPPVVSQTVSSTLPKP